MPNAPGPCGFFAVGGTAILLEPEDPTRGFAVMLHRDMAVGLYLQTTRYERASIPGEERERETTMSSQTYTHAQILVACAQE